MLPKVYAALLACLFAACQLGQNTAAYDKDPGALNPGTTASDGNKPATQPTDANPQPTQTPAPAPTAMTGPRLIGRIDPGTKLMTWSGTAIETSFTGPGGTASFATQTSTDSYIGVSVDNAPPTRVAISGPTQVPFAASGSGSHTVRFYKLNEADLGTLTFTGITFTSGGFASFTPAGRRIEFVGDSITVGYGIDQNAPCVNSAAVENAWRAYGWQTAAALGADASLIAISGHGLLRNNVGSTDTVTMPTYYTQLAAHDSTATYTFPSANAPQVVVINLGTNDYSYISYASGSAQAARPLLDQAAFVQAYQAFVTTVRQNNPSALIVLTSSPMLSDTYPSNSNEMQFSSLVSNINAVQAGLNDPNVVTLTLPTQDTTATGCDSHPNPAEAQKMATALTALIKTKLNW